ncbi:MAG: sulfate adenylyltransferase subunit CysN [Proteobacteria bacterium]|nr:sulfate adenylyltransferase subunit CysN [Pseudomonadota bacterium]
MKGKADKIIDIQEYLKKHEQKELLRFITCGSVDDGKSTLIGRLLHDSKLIYEDQLAAVKRESKKVGTTGDEPDLALLVDGLQAEREQGITIDVAYRYFSTDKRKFIIADTPGHEQYTRNMATGASTANLAIILIDARNGVLTQTKRHSFIVDLLGIKHIIVAINKMDLVGYKKEVFEKIRLDYLDFAKNLDVKDIHFVPISALKGDNVVHRSQNMKWYKGKPLMELLETIEITSDIDLKNFRFPVQYVNRPNADFRGYCGTITSGIIRVGDEICVLPSRKRSKIKSIVTYDGELKEAFAPMAVTLTLTDELDISRGDLIVHSNNLPEMSDALDVMVVWMSEDKMEIGKTYEIKTIASIRSGYIDKIHYVIDVNTLEHRDSDCLNLNEIAFCRLYLTESIPFDVYKFLPATGSFIFIDRLTNNTVGAGMIYGKASVAQKLQRKEEIEYSQFEIELNRLIRKYFPHWQAKDISKKE